MDPYLEGALWTSVHTQLSVEIARQIAPRVRPKYVVRTPRRYVRSDAAEEVGISAAMYPDASVARSTTPSTMPTSTGAAIAPAPLHLHTIVPELIPLVTVEIRDSAGHQLVTAIEVLSPTNKRGRGRREYLARRDRFLTSSAHLLEIDLLRTGERVPMLERLPDFPYFVFLARVQSRPEAEVWPIALEQPLPEVSVPLLPGDADVPLQLQDAFASMFDTFGYDLDIDYSAPPEVPLTREQSQWARELIGARENG